MSKNELLRDVPSNQHNFQLDVVGEVTKKRWLGDFTFKIPTIKDQCLAAKFEATLNGEYGGFLPKGIQNVHKKIAHLRFVVIESPKFWKDSDLGYELSDPNVINTLYDACQKFEEEWLEAIWGKEPEDEEGDAEDSEESKKS